MIRKQRGSGFTGRKVKGTIHWVDAGHVLPVQFRLFEPLVDTTEDDSEDAFLHRINAQSLQILQGFVEEQLCDAVPYDKFQFFRHGYFSVDPKLSLPKHPVFNRVVSLKSSFSV